MTDHTEMQIPDDVMMYAEMLYDDGGYKTVPRIIAEAILAERERCAKIAESVGNYGDYKREELTKDYGQPRFDLMHDIVAAIRGIQK